ncbi:MAG: hypothetical protein IKY98_03500 [Alphaproteobacteria bacterium]|nr:hypothetical protein [Alphaproteobacteria bacterium]
MKKIFLILTALSTLSACTYAGPFVTNISLSKDDIIIEKCLIKHDLFMGTISTTNCSNHMLKR